MLKRLLIGALLMLASSIHPLYADYSDLQPIAATIENDQITIHVENPTATAESARMQVAVRLANGSTAVLTSAPLTVPGSTTSTVTVSAANTVSEILDDPQPISP
jgi:hypothetical protein